jgi:hypothetical protein
LSAAIAKIKAERDKAMAEIADYDDEERKAFHTISAEASTTMRIALERWKAQHRVNDASDLSGVFALLACDLLEAAIVNASNDPVQRAVHLAKILNNFISWMHETRTVISPRAAAVEAAMSPSEAFVDSLIDVNGKPMRRHY